MASLKYVEGVHLNTLNLENSVLDAAFLYDTLKIMLKTAPPYIARVDEDDTFADRCATAPLAAVVILLGHINRSPGNIVALRGRATVS